MKLHAKPFSLDPFVQNPAFTKAEHEGLCCLVERARCYGGADDIFFLCLTEGLALVRLYCGKNSKWTADGFLFDGKQESWVWIFLPSCIRALFSEGAAVLDEVTTEGQLEAEQWLAAHRPALWAAIENFEKNTAHLLHPHSVVFSCLQAEQYGRCPLDWYAIAGEPILAKPRPIVPAQTGEVSHTEAFLTPPILLFKDWRILRDGEKYKLGELDEIEDWRQLEQRIDTLL